MFSDPEKFDPENNTLGINFKNSEKVKKFIENSDFTWKKSRNFWTSNQQCNNVVC